MWLSDWTVWLYGDAADTMMCKENDKIYMFLMVIQSKWIIQHDIRGDELKYKQKISHVNE
jgi:hypothetical protein